MMPDVGAYYYSKKTDEICEGICAQEADNAKLKLQNVFCFLKGLNIRTLLFLFVILPTALLGFYMHGQKITYFLRPIWESPPRPFNILPHYYHENATMQELCQLHGWKVRESPRRVFDAVLFSNELDMLQIRWKELFPYVTKFVILESNSTFTGLPKPLLFASNKQRYDFAVDKYRYGEVGGRKLRGQHPFVEEAFQRVALDRLLKSSGIRDGDILIMSDIDEIPSAHTVNLLRWCDGYPPIMHLQLREYLYSYEFFQGYTSWRASVHLYNARKTRYGHFRRNDEMLADSGWHCSFCFRRISDFIFKMKAYSHSDRVRFSYYLDPIRIQNKICEGTDLFDMLPEEHTFRTLISKLGPIPHSYSGIQLPQHVIQNVDQFRFLLPGNCLRDSD